MNSIAPTPGQLAGNDNDNDLTGEAWTLLRRRLLRHARMAVHESALAEDLTQETLVSVLQGWSSQRGEASVTTWATAILKRKIADWYRSPHQQRRVHSSPGTEDGVLQDDVDVFDAQGAYLERVPVWQQPEGREARREVLSALEACLGRLPSQTGRVFMMREWLGFETSEICERLGLTADNCRMILHRARMGLRQCMCSRGHSVRSVT